jgi:predicted nucleotidyltransferase
MAGLAMVSSAQILAFAAEVAAAFQPQQIVLFGSYAYGRPTFDSDVDLLVIMPYRGPSHRQAARIRLAVDAPFPMDLLVRSKPEIERRIAANDFFLKEIMERGLVLYAANDPGVGGQSRKRLRRRLAAPSLAQAQPV